MRMLELVGFEDLTELEIFEGATLLIEKGESYCDLNPCHLF